MRVTYLSEHNPADLDVMSGTSHWILNSLKQTGINIQSNYIAIPEHMLSPLEELAIRAKHYWIRFYQRAHYDPIMSLRRALQVADTFNKSRIAYQSDVILTGLTPLSAAFLESPVPIVYWTDAIYAGMIGNYPRFRFHHPDTMWDMHAVTDACLTNAKLLIFSSHWAARTAVEQHGINKSKIKVVPFGANMEITHTLDDVKTMITKRSSSTIKLLFVGKEWHRKGGDIVLNIAKALHNNGHAVEVTLVGAAPKNESLPPYVRHLPFISKNNTGGLNQLKQLYQDSHFLFVPSRAEAFGIVFCEANAFGVPCITTYVGGIPEVVKDGLNGMTFSLEATVRQYCDYIINTITNKHEYEALALSAFNEYQTRLNWGSSARQVSAYLAELC